VFQSIPRKLAQGADETLIRALGTLFGKGRSMRNFYVFDKHNHLLRGDKTLEVHPRLVVVGGEDLWVGAVPEYATSKREKFLHKSGLARQLNLNRTFAETADTAGQDVLVVLFGTAHGILHSHEFDKGVHGLGRGSVHDDVDWLLTIVQHSTVAANEGNNLGAFSRKWYLGKLERDK
jgi:hypothetical protein